MRFVTCFVVATLIASSPAFAEKSDELFTLEYSKCMDKTEGVDPAMLECIGAETSRQDKKLNDAYKKLMAELTPERQQELREAQRLWIKYMEANCFFYYDPDGGTLARLSSSGCYARAKAERAKELENFLTY